MKVGTVEIVEPSEKEVKTRPNISLADFHAYMPQHTYIYMPTREPWPAASVNARLGPVLLVNDRGEPVLDDKGEQEMVPANKWLDKNRPVEQMTRGPRAKRR